LIEQPVGIYLNWASYDELSDNVELTEVLAMRQLEELVRLRKHGAQIDYYVMDAFWFAKDGGYRGWRKPHWPNGPDRWLAACAENNIKPGLWLGANNPAWMHVIPEWQDSFDPQTGCMCCFYGGFLKHYMETLHLWYERGIRLFKFDFSDFSAAPPGIKEALLPSEIRAANTIAFRAALKSFRRAHTDVILLAYNGFEERTIQNTTDGPPAKVVDTRWLEAFDTIYCGDPRPAMNFWRSKDIYSDHMVRCYEKNDIPLRRIDNSGFMIGTTGTCYYRGAAAWKGMLLLSLSRGGLANTYYGNLELLSDGDAQWFASAQRAFFAIHRDGQTSTFGGMPGQSEPYGFVSTNARGALVTVVNPSQSTRTISLPCVKSPGLVFTDSGFAPVIRDETITLGAEQIAVLGSGEYASLSFGIETDVCIPTRIENIPTEFTSIETKTIQASVTLDTPAMVRVVARQRNAPGYAVRTSGGSPPQGASLGDLLFIHAEQAGRSLPVQINYDKQIWSGLSWMVGEVSVTSADTPIDLRITTREPRDVVLTGSVYLVNYDAHSEV
jgi:hypothetical protein